MGARLCYGEIRPSVGALVLHGASGWSTADVFRTAASSCGIDLSTAEAASILAELARESVLTVEGDDVTILHEPPSCEAERRANYAAQRGARNGKSDAERKNDERAKAREHLAGVEAQLRDAGIAADERAALEALAVALRKKLGRSLKSGAQVAAPPSSAAVGDGSAMPPSTPPSTPPPSTPVTELSRPASQVFDENSRDSSRDERRDGPPPPSPSPSLRTPEGSQREGEEAGAADGTAPEVPAEGRRTAEELMAFSPTLRGALALARLSKKSPAIFDAKTSDEQIRLLGQGVAELGLGELELLAASAWLRTVPEREVRAALSWSRGIRNGGRVNVGFLVAVSKRTGQRFVGLRAVTEIALPWAQKHAPREFPGVVKADGGVLPAQKAASDG